jgi:hypothetical protein
MSPSQTRDLNIFFNEMEKMTLKHIRQNTLTSRIVMVVAIDPEDGPVLRDKTLDLPSDAYYISKSINIQNLRIGDRLLLTEVEHDMPVVTDLLRTKDDLSDSTRVSGNLYVGDEAVFNDTVLADNGIRLKTFDGVNLSFSNGSEPSDEDFIEPPVGTLALDIVDPLAPKLWVRTGVDNWTEIKGGP